MLSAFGHVREDLCWAGAYLELEGRVPAQRGYCEVNER